MYICKGKVCLLRHITNYVSCINILFMKKKYLLFAGLYLLCHSVFCQTTLNEFGMMSVTAQTEDWWPALRVKVPTLNSCAFNLWSPYYNDGDDVAFFNAQGYLWCRLGGWFGSDSTLKRNITPITDAMDKIRLLRGVRFQYKPICAAEQQGVIQHE